MNYSAYEKNAMTLRDALAFDRTVLANERTFLAYMRSALALFAGAVTLFEFFPADQILQYVGVALLVIGTIVSGFGIFRFFHFRHNLKVFRHMQAEHAAKSDE